MKTDFASLMPRADADAVRVQSALIRRRRAICPDRLVVGASIAAALAGFAILVIWG